MHKCDFGLKSLCCIWNFYCLNTFLCPVHRTFFFLSFFPRNLYKPLCVHILPATSLEFYLSQVHELIIVFLNEIVLLVPQKLISYSTAQQSPDAGAKPVWWRFDLGQMWLNRVWSQSDLFDLWNTDPGLLYCWKYVWLQPMSLSQTPNLLIWTFYFIQVSNKCRKFNQMFLPVTVSVTTLNVCYWHIIF